MMYNYYKYIFILNRNSYIINLEIIFSFTKPTVPSSCEIIESVPITSSESSTETVENPEPTPLPETSKSQVNMKSI